MKQLFIFFILIRVGFTIKCLIWLPKLILELLTAMDSSVDGFTNSSLTWMKNSLQFHPGMRKCLATKMAIANELGCVVRMVVDSMLLHAESGPNDHRKEAPRFIQLFHSHWLMVNFMIFRLKGLQKTEAWIRMSLLKQSKNSKNPWNWFPVDWD